MHLQKWPNLAAIHGSKLPKSGGMGTGVGMGGSLVLKMRPKMLQKWAILVRD